MCSGASEYESIEPGVTRLEPARSKDTKTTDSAHQDELIFYSKSILSDKVEVTHEVLSYIRKECFEYGEIDMTGFRDHVCAVVQTDLKFAGARVVKASSGIPFIRDTELLIQSDIQRRVLNLDELDARKRKILGQVLETHPQEIDLPLRDGVDPVKVADHLKTLF